MACTSDELLQAWLSEKQRGEDLLSNFTQLLGRLERSASGPSKPHSVVQHIASKVPCPRLGAYGAGMPLASAEDDSTMELMSTCMQSLLDHQQSLHQIYRQFQQAANLAYQEVVDPPATDTPSEAASESTTLHSDQAVLSGASSIAEDSSEGRHSRSSSFSSAASGALRLVSLSDALRQELVLTDTVMSSLALDMSLDELSTYQLMWQLQPYLDSSFLHDPLAS
ncbi:hypothetical protein WJX73_001489 [Symbiochloris irregularis]|uniref:Uncharacterized protein n=1 Tax=Symbiochloris irregularis TaxID=706552 RepID=A0AAW1PXX7_9CHLO